MIIDGILFNLFVNSRNWQKNTHIKINKNKASKLENEFPLGKKGKKKNTITTLTNPNQPTIKRDVEVNRENVIIDGF